MKRWKFDGEDLLIVAILFLIVWLLAASGCVGKDKLPGGLYGYDNGEAYEKYEETMKQYVDENGLSPDIYGYGW